MMSVCQAMGRCKRHDQRSTPLDRTHPFHLRLCAHLKSPREYLRQEFPEPSPNDGVYYRVVRRCTSRAALRETLTTEDNKRALVRRRAGAHKPVIPPVVGREA